MEFCRKLQELRKQKGLTQEQLAQQLYVSRTAVSKWESGRGYPNLDSLTQLAKLFDTTVDALLSGEEILTIAQADTRQKTMSFCDLVFGLLDISCLLLLFFPFFGQKTDGMIQAVSLLALTDSAPYLLVAYYTVVTMLSLCGLITLALQNCQNPLWINFKSKLSLLISIAGVILLIVSQQPYAALLLFVFLIIKVLLLTKKQ